MTQKPLAPYNIHIESKAPKAARAWLSDFVNRNFGTTNEDNWHEHNLLAHSVMRACRALAGIEAKDTIVPLNVRTTTNISHRDIGIIRLKSNDYNSLHSYYRTLGLPPQDITLITNALEKSQCMVEAVEPFASSQHAINVKQTARNELPTLLKTFPKPLDKTQSGKDKKSALRTLMGHCISLSSENTPNWLCHFPARNSHISQQLDDWFAQLEASASEKDRPLLDKAKKKAIPMAQAINGWHAYIDATQICSKKLPVLKGRTLTAKGIFARAVKEEFATTIKTARYLLDPIRTQQSLADELGCSKQAINLWENPEKLTNYLEADRFQALKEIYRSRVPHIFKPTVEKLINRMDTLYTARPKAIARTQKAGEAVTPVALGKGSPGS